MKNIELVFIPIPGIGHLQSTLQIAKLLVDRNHRISITVFVIQLPSAANTESLCQSFTTDRIRFITLPPQPLDESKGPLNFKYIIETHKPHVKEAVAKLAGTSNGPARLAGFVLDMFCTTMIDVANEFEVPSYIFFTSSIAYLSFTFHLQEVYDRNNQEFQQLLLSDIQIPSFPNPIPSKLVPGMYLNEEIAEWLIDNTRRFRETNGILVNTFHELESQFMNSFFQQTTSSRIPKLYTVGPLLNLNENSSSSEKSDIQKWLDEQPPSSVVFLCFGSRGCFDKPQAMEIGKALERSGYIFIWSLRKPPTEGKFGMPIEYNSIEEVLPEGFLDRTMDIGKVIGWAPQMEILAHPAIGGFVSHCGWNSTLESLWFGVPIGAWPMYAEQHFNAYEMVMELGLAVEISLDFQKGFFGDNGVVVSAEKIESGIRELMDGAGEVRKKVKSKSEESKKCMIEGGSSFNSLNCFIDDVMDKMML